MTAPTLHNPAFAKLSEPWLTAGVLDLTDVHAVDRLAALTTETRPDVLLGLALAVRAPRLGHTGIRMEDPVLVPSPDLQLPVDRAQWHAEIQQSPLVQHDADGKQRPFVLTAGLLQTARMAGYEERLAQTLRDRAGYFPEDQVDVPQLQADLQRLFGEGEQNQTQKLAAAIAVLSRTTVISGGPGTGKTTTIRKVLLALHAQAEALGQPRLRVALAAPTGKAAARMRESLLADSLEPGPVQNWLAGLEAVTLHRLLGWQPQTPSRFRHSPEQPLPFDVVVVDEASMIDVAMMAKLVQAVASRSRLILLGDRNQLASVEAGSALADLTAGMGARGIGLPPEHARRLAEVLGDQALFAYLAPNAPDLAGGMVHFTQAFRYANADLAEPIYALANAANAQESSERSQFLQQALAALTQNQSPHVQLRAHQQGRLDPDLVETIAEQYAQILQPLLQDSRRDAEVLDNLAHLRVLAAHREGSLGAAGLNAQIGALVAQKLGQAQGNSQRRWWTGRLVLVTQNSYEHDLWNGDVGVVRRHGQGAEVLFRTSTGVRSVADAAMPAHETAFSITIHKSQGSQFTHAVVVLPEQETAILSRELIYTAISRAQQKLTICGSAEVLKIACERQVKRATGLAARLWP